MDCCSTEAQDEKPARGPEVVLEVAGQSGPRGASNRNCPGCGCASRQAPRKTILLMLRSELLDRVGEGPYRFCSGPECRVVYFAEERGLVFTTGDLRTRVGLKERQDPIPLCYCFGFEEAHVQGEIARAGETTIPQRIAAFIKQELCDCETRNPSGACCLGEVNKAVKRLLAEHQAASETKF